MATATRTASRSRRRRSGARPDGCSTTPLPKTSENLRHRGWGRPAHERPHTTPGCPLHRPWRAATGEPGLRENGPARLTGSHRCPSRGPSAKECPDSALRAARLSAAEGLGPPKSPNPGQNRPVPDDPEQKTPENPAMEALQQPSPYLHPSEEAALPPPSHLWPRPPPNSLSLPASVATQRLVLILIVAWRPRPSPFALRGARRSSTLVTLPTVIERGHAYRRLHTFCPNLFMAWSWSSPRCLEVSTRIVVVRHPVVVGGLTATTTIAARIPRPGRPPSTPECNLHRSRRLRDQAES